MARGRDREGVIRRSRPRLLKLSNLGLKIFGQDFDFGFSTRRHLRWGGGSLRAFRRAILIGPGFMAASSSSNPQNLSDEAYKSARGVLLKTLVPNPQT